MSTVDTSTWNPDADLNIEIEGIPLNSDAGIAQTWQALRILMAAVKGDGDAIKAMIDVMQGATASADGASGLVPKPEAGDQDKVLKGDGTWGTAAAATKLATPRMLWGNSFDGSSDISSGAITGARAVELIPPTNSSNHGGYIDFHYNQSAADYTSRIIESASGTLNINGVTISDSKTVTADAFAGDVFGNAGTATKLATARTISLTGDVSGSASFDGSANASIVATVADDSHSHVISNVDGLQTALNGKADFADVTSAFTWETSEAPVRFFAYRIGKLVHIGYQGASKTHDAAALLGTTTLSLADAVYIPFIKNNSAYGTVLISNNTNKITVSQISSASVSGRLYFNGSFLIS